MLTNIDEISLDTLANGELLKKFRKELTKVYANIENPDMPESAARAISIKLTIKPTDGDVWALDIDVQSKLAKEKPIATGIQVDRGCDGDRLVPWRKQVKGQMSMDEPVIDEGTGEVLAFPAGQEVAEG